jgi:hypothetical protein
MRSELLLKIIKNNKASGIDEIINEYLKSTVSQMMPLYKYFLKPACILVISSILSAYLFNLLFNMDVNNLPRFDTIVIALLLSGSAGLPFFLSIGLMRRF